MSRAICGIVSLFALQAAVLSGQTDPAADSDDQPMTAEEAKGAPLFASDDVLTFTLEAPFKTIFKDRSQESEYFPGKLTYQNDAGESVSVDLRVRTRGKFRLKKSTCNFPPIRLNFPRKAMAGTVFEHQNGIKFVTHCQTKKSEYEQYVLQEYLVYKIYNLLTDLSLRARLAKVTYVDSEEDDDPITKYGFFIEHDDMLAARVGWEPLSIPGFVDPSFVDPEPISMVEVFNFMIGNTDFSAFVAPPDDNECCHNVNLFGTMAGPVLPVAYDFDFSGMVDAPYAKPDPSLRIRRVTQRLFRGLCRPRESLDAVLPIFQEKRAAIYALYQEQVDLEEKQREKSIKYLDKFYEILDNPKKVTDEFVKDCRDR